jgi:hypothetical protein
MALWKLFRGSRADLDTVEKHDGYVYFCDDGTLFFDYTNADSNLQRKQINAKNAETLGMRTADEFVLKEEYINDKPSTLSTSIVNGVLMLTQDKLTYTSSIQDGVLMIA